MEEEGRKQKRKERRKEKRRKGHSLGFNKIALKTKHCVSLGVLSGEL